VVEHDNRKEAYSTANRESDRFIVLRARESRVQGEGTRGNKRRQRGKEYLVNVKEASETSAGKVRPGRLMQNSLPAISRAAKRDQKRRFRGLYSMLNRANIEVAFRALRKDAASGVDGVTYCEYETNLYENLAALEEKLKQKRYRAKLVKRVFIPKSNGKERPLGIPALEDKIVQYVVREILEAIYEPMFLECSYGYRPHRSARQAVEALRETLMQGCQWVVECDIKSFFDTIDHGWLIKMLQSRIQDEALIGLLRKWLRAGVLLPDGEIQNPERGTPQGSIISPILSNIYLHYVLDMWFKKSMSGQPKGNATLIRYADDFVVAFRKHTDAAKFYQELPKRLEKFGLTIAAEKTKKIKFSRFSLKENELFSFLGFQYCWKMSRKGNLYVSIQTSKARLRRIILDFKLWCKKNRNKRIRRIMGSVKSKLRGLYNYFDVIGNSTRLDEMYELYCKTVYRMLNRRSQRRSYNWKTFSSILENHGVLRHRSRIYNQGIQLDFFETLCS